MNGTETSSRRCMSLSSGLTGSSSETVRGSSAMPQIGQVPGASRTIWGCIGQTHSTLLTAAGAFLSSAMPHFGQAPARSDCTSGSIGQTQVPPPS